MKVAATIILVIAFASTLSAQDTPAQTDTLRLFNALDLSTLSAGDTVRSSWAGSGAGVILGYREGMFYTELTKDSTFWLQQDTLDIGIKFELGYDKENPAEADLGYWQWSGSEPDSAFGMAIADTLNDGQWYHPLQTSTAGERIPATRIRILLIAGTNHEALAGLEFTLILLMRP